MSNVGFSDEEVTAGLGEVGIKEDCVQSKNNGISVWLEERCLFRY